MLWGALRPNPLPAALRLPPLSLSSSQGLRPPPRESIHKRKLPPPSPAPPPPSTSTPSLKVIHSLSVDTSCCLLRPGFSDRDPGDCPTFPKIRRKIRLGDLATRKVPRRAGGRPSRPSRSTATATTGDPSRGVRRARGSDPGLDTCEVATWCSASRRCFAMSMAAVAFEVFYLLDGTKTDDDAGR